MRQLWTRAAVIALTAGTLGAQADDALAAGQRLTPNFPITQPAATPAAETATTTTTAPGESETLPRPTPIPTSAPTVTQTELPPPRPAPAQAAAPRPAPTKTVVTLTVNGPVVEVKGKPQVRVVESGDALDAIARGMGTTRADLAKINGLKAPYALKLGQKIKGPASDQKAYVVQTGDTMFAIAKRFSVTAAALAEENDLKAGAAIKKGQKLLLPDGFKDKGPTKTTQVIAGVPGGEPVHAETETQAPPAATTPTRAPTPTPTPASSRTPTPAAEPPVDTAAAATTTLSVTGAVVTVEGPRQVYKVKSGDTLTAIARRFDMSVSDLAEDNKLKADRPLRLGTRIKGPATTRKAYVAQSGDTLSDIARRFNISVKALATENGLKSTATIKKGQKIRLPEGFKDKGPLKSTTTPRPAAPANTYARVETPTTPRPAAPANTYARVETPTTPSSPVPYSPGASRPTGPVAAQPITPAPVRPIIESSQAPTEAEIIASGKGKFAWPLRGEIISDFGIKGTGQRNDGLDIRAPQGTPVLSAADGKIAYAGNQVPGFGNLVLVRHADGWVTAYAHLSSISVKMQQDVRQGEQLGAVGATGGATEPKLHFEMRFAPTVKDKAKPVDPALLLPR